MLNYIIRRIIYSIFLLFLVSIVGFVVIQLPPGDFLTVRIQELRNRGDLSAEIYAEQLRARYGLDKPIWMQYIIWITNFVKGDFGWSFYYEKPVSELIGERLALTITISVITLIFTWALAIPIGVYSATHQYSWGDNIFTFLGFIGLSVPSFLLALLLMFISVFYFNQSVGGLFSPEYINAPWNFAKIIDLFRHLWIPVIIIGLSGTAGLIRIMRGNLLDILGQQYILTARAKGLKESIVIWKHAVRVAINPLISSLGMSLPGIISGESLVSIVLNLPTTGPLFLEALTRQDMFLAGSFLMFLTTALVAGNFIADLALAWADPRIRYEE
ncbi:MAG TPA: ABC transporter permease [bacterium]|nr:ABC transporter permease [bacterium]HOL55104.1 ABC transporter permease [bacterium]HOP56163.1 ABC transporter permease [bacterium]HPC77630.1 ABC transporter permease [bacterium]HPO82070.1 ABC transporter permease [bacterium]